MIWSTVKQDVGGRWIRAHLFYGAFLLAAAWSTGASGQTSLTRSSSFAYDPNSGLLTQEVIEPNTQALRLETDYVYDAFGNKTSVTVVGIDVASRSTTTAYDSLGQFSLTTTNALSQSESWQYDPRFGLPTSHTGPNGLTTTWSYDAAGHKIKEVRPDGTQTTWAYQYCSGVNGGTATCVAGATYLIKATPLASDGATQNGPVNIVYFDTLDREIARDTQGFDSSTVRVAKQYDSLGRMQKSSRPYFAANGTPQWTTFTYDTLDRAVTEQFPDSSTTQHAYHGLVTSDTNGLNQTRTVTKDSQGHTVSVQDAAGNSTSFAYDPVGNLIQTIDAVGNTSTNTYDVRGRKVASNDPDLGVWSYAYDTANELVGQTDAKHQTATFSYDVLGRMVARIEPDMTATWVYDAAPNAIGKLISASITAGPDAGYQRSYAYDGIGRPVQAATTVGGTTYTFAGAYDTNSRLSQITYPTGFAVRYTYTSLGYTSQLAAVSTGEVYWTANARDAELHLTQQTTGNGVVTTQSFDAPTGRLVGVQAGTNNLVANFSYNYDVLGDLKSRADANQNLSESLTYDNVNRLTASTVNLTPTPLVKSFVYDPVGNLLAKSDVGLYLYPPAGSALPHAVTSISGGAINTAFTYDADGNQTAGLGRSISYTSYNKPASITQGTSSLFFSHDPDHQRFKQVAPEGTTLYFNVFGIHAELFSSARTQWNEYLIAGDALIGVRFEHSDETVSTRYFTQDHLGSIAVITDEGGVVQERLSYDAWGKRRFANGTDDPSDSITSQTTRGFTGQEMLADVGLVHLNGRVYDPLVGRMMSADPFVPDPTNGQSWNRYSYVINNPLSITDPNGYCFLGLCSLFRAIERFFSQNLGQILQMVAMTACALVPACGPFLPLVAAASSAIITGVTTGNLALALKAGVIAGVTALAFNAVGDATSHMAGAIPGLDGSHGTFIPFSEGHLANIAGHALIGCVSAVASGSKCGPGALAAGASSAAGPFIGDNKGFSIGSLVANTVVGGVAAVAGGGKFANGALMAAFGYLFNQAANQAQGEAAERLWQQSAAAAGEDVYGRKLLYYVVDENGNAIPNPKTGASLWKGEMDGLSGDADLLYPAELKNGPYAKFEDGQLERSDYVKAGQIKFYGTAAEQAGIAGETLSEVAAGRPIFFRFYAGPLGAGRATRQYLRWCFKGCDPD